MFPHHYPQIQIDPSLPYTLGMFLTGYIVKEAARALPYTLGMFPLVPLRKFAEASLPYTLGMFLF